MPDQDTNETDAPSANIDNESPDNSNTNTAVENVAENDSEPGDSDASEVVDDAEDTGSSEESAPVADDQSEENSDNNDATANNTEDNSNGIDESEQASSAPTVRIARISSTQAPILDGLGAELNEDNLFINEWMMATQFDNQSASLAIDSLMIANPADGRGNRILRRWAAMHDDEYLYLVILSDDVGARFSDSSNGWHDDSIEIFIDGDNSKSSSWEGSNDVQLIIPLQKSNTTEANNIDGRFLFVRGTEDKDIEFDFFTGPGVGPDGVRAPNWEQDVYEVKIKLSDVDIIPNRAFGLEIQMNDDDDGQNRDSKWGWFHPARSNDTDTDTTFRDPSVMGTVILAQ